jgi:uncharacterized membrane-anchored protein YhcB (DUF1043 family)
MIQIMIGIAGLVSCAVVLSLTAAFWMRKERNQRKMIEYFWQGQRHYLDLSKAQVELHFPQSREMDSIGKDR